MARDEAPPPAPPEVLARPQMSLIGDIDKFSVQRFHDQLREAEEAGGDIALEVTTEGGDAEMGRRLALDIEAARARLPGRFLFIGKTVVYSAGITIMSAFPCRDRWLAADAMLMIHGRKLEKTIELAGPIRTNIPMIEALLAQMRTAIEHEEAGYRRLIDDCDIGVEEVRKKALLNWYLDAGEALRRGLVAGRCGLTEGQDSWTVLDHLLLKLRVRDAVSEEEEAAIRGLVGEVRDVPADKTIIRAGDKLEASTLLLDGFLCRYKDLRDGSRQISELHVAGDFADLHSFTLKHLDHSIMALTPCRIAIVPHERLKTVTRKHPHLARLFWFLTNLDAAIHREWVLSLGRRSAPARVAHLFCELRARLGIVGLADETGFDLPLTQTDLAECLGLTPIHVNRTLKQLREAGLVEFRRRRVAIQNLPGLERAAEFDPAYLYLVREAR